LLLLGPLNSVPRLCRRPTVDRFVVAMVHFINLFAPVYNLVCVGIEVRMLPSALP